MAGLLQMMLSSAGKDKDPNFDLKKNLIGNLGDDFITYEKAPKSTKLEDLQKVPSLTLIGSPDPAGLLEAPVYTKPAVWRDREVPEVLRSGDHGRIARWRRTQSLLRTASRRPDLMDVYPAANLDKKDRVALDEGGFRIPPPDVAK